MRQTCQTSVRCKVTSLTAAAFALLLTACGMAPSQPEPRVDPGLDRVVGTVTHVDSLERTLEITTDRDSRIARGQRIDLHYDEFTTVVFEGNDYRPEDLEPGDRIVAEVEGDLAYLEVRSVLVTEDATPGHIPDSDDRVVVGNLRHIDTRDRILIVEPADRGRDLSIRYDDRTRVLYDDRRIGISELRELDVLEIDLARGSDLAESITVVANGYASDPRNDSSTARGEVVFVDESRRELVIATDDRNLSVLDRPDSFDARSSFDTRTGDRATFRFDRDVIVEYQGNYYGPSNLERGDGVEIDYERNGDELWAERILVTYSVRQ